MVILCLTFWGTNIALCSSSLENFHSFLTNVKRHGKGQRKTMFRDKKKRISYNFEKLILQLGRHDIMHFINFLEGPEPTETEWIILPTTPETWEWLGRCSGQGHSTQQSVCVYVYWGGGGEGRWVIVNLQFNFHIQIKCKVVIKEENQSDSTLLEKKRLKKVDWTQF